jgi:hypothetical protein
MRNFGIWELLDPFRNKIAKLFYGPSISHKDDHFASVMIIFIDF